MKREVLQTAQAIVEARSPREAIVVGEGISDGLVWAVEGPSLAIHPSSAKTWPPKAKPHKKRKTKARR